MPVAADAPPDVEHRLLDGSLRGDDLGLLLRDARRIQLRPRQRVLHGAEDRVVLLLSGAVMSRLGTADGDEVITAIVGAGNALGLATRLAGVATEEEWISLATTTGVSIPGDRLRALVDERPAITRACLRTLTGQVAVTAAERSRFAGTAVADRVGARLVELATRWGRREGDHVRILLPLTQSELAAWSGASRESVAKILHRLREAGLLDTARRSLIVLDLEALQRRAQPHIDGVPMRLLPRLG